MFVRVENIIDASTENPIELARIAGCDPKQFFRGACFKGVDVRGLDLSGMDLTGANFEGVIADMSTRVPAEHIIELREEALKQICLSLESVVDDRNFMDHYVSLATLRNLSEYLNIGVSGQFDRYFQDGEPSFRSISYTLYPSTRTIPSKDIRTRLKKLKGRRPRGAFLWVSLETEVPKNSPPSDSTRIHSIRLEKNYQVNSFGENALILYREDGSMDFNTKFEVVVSTDAVPRKFLELEFQITQESDEVELDLERMRDRVFSEGDTGELLQEGESRKVILSDKESAEH